MLFVILALTLCAGPMAAEVDAETEAEQLAKMFSPILILTEETGGKWGDIIVTKPEPVGIMGARSADNLHFIVFSSLTEAKLREFDSYLNWDPPLGGSKVSFSQGKFAFFSSGSYTGRPPGGMASGSYYVQAYFNFSGSETTGWNAEYERIGENFPNTAYVHIYKRVVDQYQASHDSVTVIQYHYFYPYNDWWNNHEGDWQRIDVVVSSGDPDTAVLLGVEYRFHKAWLSYYRDWASKPGFTTSFVFNPRTTLKVSPGPERNEVVQYTHPVVYVGAGSHAGYPVGGNVQLYHRSPEEIAGQGGSAESEEVQGTVGGDYERMTHSGMVLSTDDPAPGLSLWERYDLQLLPEPDRSNNDNMGLADTLSWLGAKIRWGTPSVDGPRETRPPLGDGNQSPENGPFDSDDGSWGDLKFFEIAKLGPGIRKFSIHHSDLPYSDFHHWAILGDETWSGTVALSGDVVVFPGARLTIEEGTIVTFPSRFDRHQFKEGNSSLSEIFVYGTLKSVGTGSKQIVFRGPDLSDSAQHWGGIRMMAGSSEMVSHTQVRNAPVPSVRPTSLTAEAGDGQATLRWVEPSASDPSITGWEYRMKLESASQWGDWTAVSGRATREAVVSNLAHGVLHQFEVRAVNTTGVGPSSAVSVALLQVVFASSSYELIEGGQAVQEGPVGLAEDPSQASRRARVTVQLTPAPSARVRIPVVVTSRSSGYKVVDLDAAGLLFRRDSASASFVIRAVRDADTVDATIGLSFGTLPAGVLAGVPSTSTVTIYDTPNQPTGLTATPGHGQMTLRWNNPNNPRIAGWQYRARPVGTAQGTWTTIDPSGASTTEYTVPNLTDGKEYRFRVRAYTRGYGLTSEPVEAIPSGLRATAYNGAVGQDWVDPKVAGLARWRSRHRPVPGDWSSYTVHGGGAGTQVVRNLTNDQEYRFEVQGLNAAGQTLDRETCTWSGGRPCTWQAMATPKATLSPPPNQRPVLSGPDSVWYAEGRQDSVARYPATDATRTVCRGLWGVSMRPTSRCAGTRSSSGRRPTTSSRATGAGRGPRSGTTSTRSRCRSATAGPRTGRRTRRPTPRWRWW